jgi:hypothetical protein
MTQYDDKKWIYKLMIKSDERSDDTKWWHKLITQSNDTIWWHRLITQNDATNLLNNVIHNVMTQKMT